MLLEDHWSAEFKSTICRNPRLVQNGHATWWQSSSWDPGVFSVSSLCKTELVAAGLAWGPGLAVSTGSGYYCGPLGGKSQRSKHTIWVRLQAPAHMRCVLGCVSVSCVCMCVFACVKISLKVTNRTVSVMSVVIFTPLFYLIRNAWLMFPPKTRVWIHKQYWSNANMYYSSYKLKKYLYRYW